MADTTTTRLTVATLNTRGLPLKGTRIAERFAAIAAEIDASDIDLVCLQRCSPTATWHTSGNGCQPSARSPTGRRWSARRVAWSRSRA